MKVYSVIITAFDVQNKGIGKYSRGVLDINLFVTYEKAIQFIKEYFKNYGEENGMSDIEINSYKEENTNYENYGGEILEMEVK